MREVMQTILTILIALSITIACIVSIILNTFVNNYDEFMTWLDKVIEKINKKKKKL